MRNLAGLTLWITLLWCNVVQAEQLQPVYLLDWMRNLVIKAVPEHTQTPPYVGATGVVRPITQADQWPSL